MHPESGYIVPWRHSLCRTRQAFASGFRHRSVGVLLLRDLVKIMRYCRSLERILVIESCASYLLGRVRSLISNLCRIGCDMMMRSELPPWFGVHPLEIAQPEGGVFYWDRRVPQRMTAVVSRYGPNVCPFCSSKDAG